MVAVLEEVAPTSRYMWWPVEVPHTAGYEVLLMMLLMMVDSFQNYDLRNRALSRQSSLDRVSASPTRSCLSQFQGLEVQPDLTDVVADLGHLVGTGGGAGGGGVGRGVAGVSHVGIIVGHSCTRAITCSSSNYRKKSEEKIKLHD